MVNTCANQKNAPQQTKTLHRTGKRNETKPQQEQEKTSKKSNASKPKKKADHEIVEWRLAGHVIHGQILHFAAETNKPTMNAR